MQGGPNYPKIYSFLGSLFDPTASNQAEMLSEMSPVDRETIQLLLHNLTMNLDSSNFREQHSYLLDQYQSILQNAFTLRRSLPEVSDHLVIHLIHSKDRDGNFSVIGNNFLSSFSPSNTPPCTPDPDGDLETTSFHS